MKMTTKGKNRNSPLMRVVRPLSFLYEMGEKRRRKSSGTILKLVSKFLTKWS
jgi:hypothetical protein